MPDTSAQRSGHQAWHIAGEHPGTVDSDYRGEIGVILVNLSNQPFTVNDGERVCQMVITRYTRVDWEPTDRIDSTERGDGAFGHTGTR